MPSLLNCTRTGAAGAVADPDSATFTWASLVVLGWDTPPVLFASEIVALSDGAILSYWKVGIKKLGETLPLALTICTKTLLAPWASPVICGAAEDHIVH